VALKVLAVPRADEAARRRMLREARILARLEHPGIVPVHDVGSLADGRIWYTMKRVEGHRLDEHLASVPELPRRLAVFERVCEAVAFAHAHGVIHRDLKPGNVMVGPFGEVLVMDWGVAKLRDAGEDTPPDEAETRAMGPDDDDEADDETVRMEASAAADTRPGTVLGTPGYMAPEQAAGRAHEVDERSDVFALGALLRRVAAPDDGPLPKRLDAIHRRATSERPGDRYASVPDLAADVRAFLDGTPIVAYRESPLEAIGRHARRHRIALLLLGAYMIVRALMFALTRT
jgi:serine/threonine protein kinase